VVATLIAGVGAASVGSSDPELAVARAGCALMHGERADFKAHVEDVVRLTPTIFE
jgi:hypothetical protein